MSFGIDSRAHAAGRDDAADSDKNARHGTHNDSTRTDESARACHHGNRVGPTKQTRARPDEYERQHRHHKRRSDERADNVNPEAHEHERDENRRKRFGDNPHKVDGVEVRSNVGGNGVEGFRARAAVTDSDDLGSRHRPVGSINGRCESAEYDKADRDGSENECHCESCSLNESRS